MSQAKGFPYNPVQPEMTKINLQYTYDNKHQQKKIQKNHR